MDIDVHVLAEADSIALGSGELDADALVALARAQSFYRGRFLEGLYLAEAPDFEDWRARIGDLCERRINRIADRPSGWQWEAGDLSSALEKASSWVARDPYDEIAQRRLIRIHLARGDRSGALHAFETCVRLLETELGVDPHQQTVDLGELVRATAMAEHELADPMDPPLVGRLLEHRQLA